MLDLLALQIPALFSPTREVLNGCTHELFTDSETRVIGDSVVIMAFRYMIPGDFVCLGCWAGVLSPAVLGTRRQEEGKVSWSHTSVIPCFFAVAECISLRLGLASALIPWLFMTPSLFTFQI